MRRRRGGEDEERMRLGRREREVEGKKMKLEETSRSSVGE